MKHESNTDAETTMNRNGRRLAEKVRIERTGAGVPSAGRRLVTTGTVAIPGNKGGKRRFGSAVFPVWIGVFPTSSHDFPAFPTFSHLIFLTTDGHEWTRMRKRPAEMEFWSIGDEGCRKRVPPS